MEQIVIQTSDGFPLAAYYFAPNDANSTHHPVILAAATGVPASFYFDFASYLSELGCAVLLFDYRYLGKSWPRGKEQKTREDKIEALRSAKDVKISVHWVRDFEASLRFLLEKFGVRRKVVVVGHSVGGHLLPLLSQDLLDKVERTIWVGSMNPYFGFSSNEKQRRAWTKIAIKRTAEEGYYPARDMGQGHDLPAGVLNEWYGWMEFEPYFAHDKAEKLKHYTVSTLSIALTDDVIAEGNPGMTDRILKSLPNCPSTRLLVDPVTRGWPHPIGHLNSFAALQREGIWTLMRDFIVDGTMSKKAGESEDFNGGCFGQSLTVAAVTSKI